MNAAAPVAGLLLTGGRSRRMGRDKATLEHPSGRTWAEQAGAVLARVAAPALEVGPGRSGLLAVAETDPDGPLAAVAAGFGHLRSLGSDLPALVVACDLPGLTPALLQLIAGWPAPGSVVPVTGGRPQWCCARYSPACLREVVRLVAGGRRDLRALAEADPELVFADEAALGLLACQLVDADTPDELAALGLDHARAERPGRTAWQPAETAPGAARAAAGYGPGTHIGLPDDLAEVVLDLARPGLGTLLA